MNKLFVTLALINCICASTKFDGLYLGKQIGINAIVAKKDSVLNINDLTKGTKGASDTETFKSKGALGAHGLLVGVFGGYGQTFKGAYLGLEAYYNVSKNDILLIKTSSENSKISATGNCGAKLRIGYIVSPDTMLYGAMGSELNEWKHKSDKVQGTQVKAPKVYFTYSAGVETHLNDNLFLRGEYMYVPGPNMELTTRTDAVTSTSKVEACQHRITLGIGYRF